ncbi:hypothetical protein BY458DRAFT_459791 [Sporodiniella umbellata]|nr:hypothetical protein BY458DRAFT_459791 [Sporodiniella umbellata]
MQVLGSKQQQLNDSKKTYTESENRVKQLKEEATAARKELEDLKRREHAIEKECRTVESLKEQFVQQNKLLEQSVVQHQAEFAKELEVQRELLTSIRLEVERLSSADHDALVKNKLQSQAEERALLVQDIKRVSQEIDSNTTEFIQQAKQEILSVLQCLNPDHSLEDQISQCHEAVNTLAIKIK